MSIESDNRQQSTQPEGNQGDQWAETMHHRTAETARPPVEHRDDQSGEDARVELARMKEAEAKRKQRNIFIGGGTIAGLLLAGGGVFAGSKIAGGGEGTSNDPAAEAPANPGGEVPVDEPANPIAENPGTSPTDIPSFEDEPAVDPVETENPDFIDLSTEEQREGASAEEILNFYSGMEKRWVEGTGDDAGVTYVSDFLVARGATTPIVENADGLIQMSGLSLRYVTGPDGETTHTAVAMNENLATVFNTYLANKDELGLDIDSVDPVNRYFFNGAGKRIVRGLDETLDNTNLCLDRYDCLKAYENEDFRQMFNEIDELPEGSAVEGVTLLPSLSGRYAKTVKVRYVSPGQESRDFIQIDLKNGFTVYPMHFDVNYLETSSTRAASLNQVYRGMPYGESAEAYLYLSNDEQIQDKIGNPNLQ